MTGAAREAVDKKREEGIEVGLLKIRLLRPFPEQEVCSALKGRVSIGVIDRNVSFGWNSGIIYQEIRSALYGNKETVPIVPFVTGLGGEDVRVEHFLKAIDIVVAAGQDGATKRATTWL